MSFTEEDFHKLMNCFGVSDEMKPYFLKTIIALEIYSELDCGGTAILNSLKERISTPRDLLPYSFIDKKSSKRGNTHIAQDYNMSYPVSRSLKFWQNRHYDLRLRYGENGDVFTMNISNKDGKDNEELKASAIFRSDGKYISQVSIIEQRNNYFLRPLNDPEMMACLPLVNNRLLKMDKMGKEKD